MSHHNPDQYQEQSEGLEPRRLKDILFTPTPLETATTELADWMDTKIIANVILDALEAAGKQPILYNGKLVYTEILMNTINQTIPEAIILIEDYLV